MAEPLLAVSGLKAGYGDFQALFGIDLAVGHGEVLALIGANGAGKSTLLKALTGLVPCAPAMVRLKGEAIGGMRPDRIARRGVALVPEGRRLFRSLSVEENLIIGGERAPPGRWTLQRVYELFPILKEKRRNPATALSGGQQQMVAIGRALMANPELLLFDEISLGLAPVVIKDIYAAFPAIAATGVAIVLVEQDVSRALGVAGRFVCMQEGRISLAGRPAEHSRADITAAYFGTGGAALMDWVNAIVQGILLGGLYALFAAGLSLIFGVMRLVNIAHGDLIVLAAYLALTVVGATGLHPLASALIVVPLMAAIGYGLQRLLLNPTLGNDLLPPLLVTFGISVILQNGLLTLYTADSRRLAAGPIETASLEIVPGLTLGVLPLIMFAVSVLLIFGLELIFSRTSLGRAFRATSDDAEIAQLMMIDRRHIFGMAMALSAAVVAVAGIFLAIRTNFDPASGPARLLFGFEAVIIGGLGNLWGTLAGGVVLGVAQAIGAQISPGWQILAGHLMFFVVLALRPRGLFPRMD